MDNDVSTVTAKDIVVVSCEISNAFMSETKIEIE